MVELRQLTALVTVGEVGSITRAAEVLRLAQPSVTRQIRMLEEELGVPLFERTRTGMTPTPEGEILIERSRRALTELRRARLEVGPDRADLAGTVTLGLLESVVDVLAEPLVTAVRDAYPNIELRMLTAYSGHLRRWLDEGDVDLTLLYNISASDSLAVVPLVDESLWVVAPGGTGLSPTSPVPSAEVLEHHLVLPVPGHGLRTLVDQALGASADRLEVAVQVNSLHLQKRLVAAGHGWSILPAAGVATEISSGQLDGAPLCEPTVHRRVVLGIQRATRVAPSLRAVTTLTGQVVRRTLRDGTWTGAQAAS